MFIDSHAHITSDQFNDDREETIVRAIDAGIDFIVNPGTDLEDSKRAVALADKHPEIYACVGFHPHDARKADDKSLGEIEELSKHPKVVGDRTGFPLRLFTPRCSGRCVQSADRHRKATQPPDCDSYT